MRISVIIPTRNRLEILTECLDSFKAQECRAQLEFIVADDGSDDGTGEAVAKMAVNWPALKYLRQEKKGPAAARNLGLRSASGDIVLFTGDDMLPEPGMLEAHAAYHSNNPEDNAAMLGRAYWDPRIDPSPFAKWLENGGPQFGYSNLEPGRLVKAFWTANISLKRSFLERYGGFDEDFRYAAAEDIELGIRLTGKGLLITYKPESAVRHLHRITFRSFCRRQELAGRSIALLERKHPGEAAPQNEKLPFWKTALLNLAPVLKHLITAADSAGIAFDPRWYDLVLSYYSKKGRRSGSLDD